MKKIRLVLICLAFISFYGCAHNNEQNLIPDFIEYTGLNKKDILESKFRNNEGYVHAKISDSQESTLYNKYKFEPASKLDAKQRGHVYLHLFDVKTVNKDDLFYLQEKTRDQYDYFIIVISREQHELHFCRYFEEPQPGIF